MTPSKPRRLSKQMRKVLEVLSVSEGIIHRGTTAGEVEAANVSRYQLYRAVEKGWAARYPKPHSLNKDGGSHTPLYYRTAEGSRVLEDDIRLYGPSESHELEHDDGADPGAVDPGVVDELYRLTEQAESLLRSGENLRAAEIFDQARGLAESAGAPQETLTYFTERAKDQC